jgi:L-lysine exporter family protein LysE/ArgO
MAVAYLHGLILAIGLILPLGVQNFYIFTQRCSEPEVCSGFTYGDNGMLM